jgi:hypothetical protein|nr:MAG TPA: hypothetical protein [Caudoviricetes sp.]
MKKTYYFAAMDECLTAIVDAINSKRESAEFYRTNEIYKDDKTGKLQPWAEKQALECDAIANEMEKIVYARFDV